MGKNRRPLPLPRPYAECSPVQRSSSQFTNSKSTSDLLVANIRPFAALRPKPELAAQVCELPYDVMSSEEARLIASGNPLSFLHVSKPEIDLPPSTHIYSEVYAQG